MTVGFYRTLIGTNTLGIWYTLPLTAMKVDSFCGIFQTGKQIEKRHEKNKNIVEDNNHLKLIN